MALKLICDCGCGAELDEKSAKKIGQLEPVFYCAPAAAAWEAYEEAEEAKRIEIVTAFEAWRAENLSALKDGSHAFGRGKKKRALKALPDEFLAPEKP